MHGVECRDMWSDVTYSVVSVRLPSSKHRRGVRYLGIRVMLCRVTICTTALVYNFDTTPLVTDEWITQTAGLCVPVCNTALT